MYSDNIPLKPLEMPLSAHLSAAPKQSSDTTRDTDLVPGLPGATATGLPGSGGSTGSDADLDSTAINLFGRRANLVSAWYQMVLGWSRKLWAGPTAALDPPPARFSSWLAPLDALPDKMPFGAITFAAYCGLWLAVFWAVLGPYLAVPPVISSSHNDAAGSGTKNTPIVSLGCTDQLWAGKNAACGMNGEKCRPTGDVVVRCPALCDRSWTYSFIPVGDQRIKYRGFFVGGGANDGTNDGVGGGAGVGSDDFTAPYRADLFICGSAVHAGLVSPFTGGCARVTYRGGQAAFALAPGHYGTDDSVAFNSYFPLSYVFTAVRRAGDTVVGCRDPRLVVLVMNIVLAVPVVYFGLGAAAWWTSAVVGFWTIILATDPPLVVDAADPGSLPALMSLGLERFLPSCFILYVLWHCSARHTFGRGGGGDVSRYVAVDTDDYQLAPLSSHDSSQNYRDSPQDYRDSRPAPTAYLKRLLLFHPPFWLGVLNNITFDRLPVDRLTVQDLQAQAGSIFAVAGIVLLIASGALIQATAVWRAGQFRRYIKLYAVLAVALVALAQLPGLTLRIHHYILAMLLIPGCFTKGGTAIAFQGILLGLFLSGAARWGLAAIAESAQLLRRGDPGGGMLPPRISSYHEGILSWENYYDDGATAPSNGSVAVLINDLERYVGEGTSVNLTAVVLQDEELAAAMAVATTAGTSMPLYVRLGRVVGKHYGDFTAAAVVDWHNQTMEISGDWLT